VPVRGDAGLTQRLLLRGTGFAGLVTAAGGGLVLTGVLCPWYAVVAEVSMLGGDSSQIVATLPGFPATPGGWIAGGLGVFVTMLGALIAFDRPPLRGRQLARYAGVLLLAVATVSLAWVPELTDIAAGTTAELLDTADQLPVGVELELHATAASGPWWVMAGAATVVVGAFSARAG